MSQTNLKDRVLEGGKNAWNYTEKTTKKAFKYIT